MLCDIVSIERYMIGIAGMLMQLNGWFDLICLNPYIEEEQTSQWPIEKVQKDKQRSTTHTYKTTDLVTRT
jgi:hypothetical protein